MNTIKKLSLTLLIASSLLGVNSVNAMGFLNGVEDYDLYEEVVVEESADLKALVAPFNALVTKQRNQLINNNNVFVAIEKTHFENAKTAIKNVFVEHFTEIMNEEDMEAKLKKVLTSSEGMDMRKSWNDRYISVHNAYGLIANALDANVTGIKNLNDRAEALYAFCEVSKAELANKNLDALVKELLTANQVLANEHIKEMLFNQTAANQMLATLINIENVKALFVSELNDTTAANEIITKVVTMVADRVGCNNEADHYTADHDSDWTPSEELNATLVQIDERVKLLKGENVDETKIVHKKPLIPGVMHIKTDHTAITHEKVMSDTERTTKFGVTLICNSVVDYMDFDKKGTWIDDALICLKDKTDKALIEKEIKALTPHVYGIYAVELAIIKHNVTKAA